MCIRDRTTFSDNGLGNFSTFTGASREVLGSDIDGGFGGFLLGGTDSINLDMFIADSAAFGTNQVVNIVSYLDTFFLFPSAPATFNVEAAIVSPGMTSDITRVNIVLDAPSPEIRQGRL